MKKYYVVASIFDDLHTENVVRNPWAKDPRFSTKVHEITCNSLEEIPDLFLDVCETEFNQMNSRTYWYVNDGNGWVLADLRWK